MLFYLTSRIVSSVVAFLYPGYASYKTLSQRPASEEDLERWLMYWSVLGCVVGVEYVAEWLVSWVPFYYTFKTLFLLYLALPQTKGSTYLYLTYLQPFFHIHESQIDATIAQLKVKVYAFVQERLRSLWQQVSAAVGQQSQQQGMNPATATGQAGQTTSLGNQPTGPAQLVASLWTSYAPGLLASGAAFLRQGAVAAANRVPTGTAAQPLNTPTSSYIRNDATQSVLERKRQLEAELAALNSQATTVGMSSVPMPTASPQLPSRGSSDSDFQLRERTTSGRFEEIEVPSDVEGYDVDGTGADDGVGHPAGGSQRRGSGWFGGWSGGGASSKAGYERVKSD